MEITVKELSEAELDGVFGGFGHRTRCMTTMSAGECELPCCRPVLA
ncbi:MAG: hypothetical protein ACJ74O_18570 [Frankiaceae bacterium]